MYLLILIKPVAIYICVLTSLLPSLLAASFLLPFGGKEAWLLATWKKADSMGTCMTYIPACACCLLFLSKHMGEEKEEDSLCGKREGTEAAGLFSLPAY